MRHDRGQRNPAHDFGVVWRKLKASGRRSLRTMNGHDFDAFADWAAKGSHQGQEVVRIEKDGRTFAYIYPCCWGCTTNCYGTWVGGYIEALDLWV